MSCPCSGTLICAMGSVFPCCAPQQAGKRQSLQQRKAVLGPQPRCYCALWSAGLCQAAPARREDGRTVRKEQQKAVVAEQPVLRAAARLRASTPAMATSSSPGQDNAWLQRGRAARNQSSLRHPQHDPGRQEGWGEVSCQLQNSGWCFPAPKHCRAAGRSC